MIPQTEYIKQKYKPKWYVITYFVSLIISLIASIGTVGFFVNTAMIYIVNFVALIFMFIGIYRKKYLNGEFNQFSNPLTTTIAQLQGFLKYPLMVFFSLLYLPLLIVIVPLTISQWRTDGYFSNLVFSSIPSLLGVLSLIIFVFSSIATIVCLCFTLHNVFAMEK